MSEKVSSYQFWSAEEDAILIAAWGECKTLVQIATLLNDSGLEPRGPSWTHSRCRTPDTVRMRVQTLRKHGVNLPTRDPAVQRWRDKAANAVQLLIEANRAEKARLRALQDELKAAKEAQKAAMEAQKEAERLELERKAALEARLFADNNLTQAELDREATLDPGRIPFIGTAFFIATRRFA